MSGKSELTKEERRRKRAYAKRRRIIFPISRISFLLTLLLSVIFFIVLKSLKVIPNLWLLIFAFLLLMANIYVAVIALSRSASNKRKLQQSLISVFLCIFMLAGSVVIPSYKGRLAKIFNPMPAEGTMNINVYTLKDSAFNDVKSLSGATVATQSKLDKDFQAYAISQVNREIKEPIVEHIVKDIYSAVDLLYEGAVAAVMFNESYLPLLEENEDYRDFQDKVSMVFQAVQKVSFQYDIKAVGNITKEPFVIGILGNDESSLESLKKSSGFRSDVNMLCVVNPVTKQALVITVPRDSYVAVDGNKSYMDKLTHSTLYSSGSKTGFSYWINTMNTLLDCKINYTMKVNFISVVLILNAIGGVDINNPYEFTTKPKHPVFDEAGKVTGSKHYTFPAGDIHLDGGEALAYVRERYGLPRGDFDRNKHQAIVLRAMIDKATSPAILSKANALLDSMKGNFTTNMKVDEMFALAQMQLEELAKWDVVSYAIDGVNDSQYCYQLGGSASVVSLKSSSVQKAQEYIDKIMANEKIVME